VLNYTSAAKLSTICLLYQRRLHSVNWWLRFIRSETSTFSSIHRSKLNK